MNSQNQSKYRLQTHNLEFSLLIWFHIYGLFGEWLDFEEKDPNDKEEWKRTNFV